MQALPAGRREPVHLRPAVVLRRLPLRADPALQLQPLQRRVERPELDVEPVAGAVANRAGDRVPVQRAEQERSKDEEVEHAVEGFHILRDSISSLSLYKEELQSCRAGVKLQLPVNNLAPGLLVKPVAVIVRHNSFGLQSAA